MTTLADTLATPARRVPLDGLAQHWQSARIEALLPGFGVLHDDLVLANRIRGALGRRLMQGASPQALAGRACPWRPPCALDVLFREQMRIGKHGLPKPFTLALDRRGQDLAVRVTLFGFAIDWAAAASHALAAALGADIDWRDRAMGRFLPKAEVAMLAVSETAPRVHAPRPAAVLRFVTPLDAAGDDPRERPATVIGRLARRVDLTARWMGVEVEADWPALARTWNQLDYHGTTLSRAEAMARRSGRGGQDYRQPLVTGELCLAGPLEPIWPILVLGQSCHAGRGATQGLGRFLLEPG